MNRRHFLAGLSGALLTTLAHLHLPRPLRANPTTVYYDHDADGRIYARSADQTSWEEIAYFGPDQHITQFIQDGTVAHIQLSYHGHTHWIKTTDGNRWRSQSRYHAFFPAVNTQPPADAT